MSVTVTKDRVEKVLEAVRAADEYQVLVGFPEETNARKEGEVTNAQLGYIHNNGSPAANIPARPFLDPLPEGVEDKVADILNSAIKKALDGDDDAVMNGLQLVGIMASDVVKEKITKGPFVPLQPETIRRKKSSKPLIDTEQMRAAVTYVVREK